MNSYSGEVATYVEDPVPHNALSENTQANRVSLSPVISGIGSASLGSALIRIG